MVIKGGFWVEFRRARGGREGLLGGRLGVSNIPLFPHLGTLGRGGLVGWWAGGLSAASGMTGDKVAGRQGVSVVADGDGDLVTY